MPCTIPTSSLIARTDAIAVEGFDARDRPRRAYVEAGADMVFVEAPTTEEQIAEIARRVPGWKLINMFQGGKTPLLPTRRLARTRLPARHHPQRPPARRHRGDEAGAALHRRRRQHGGHGREHGDLQGAGRGDRHRRLSGIGPPLRGVTGSAK